VKDRERRTSFAIFEDERKVPTINPINQRIKRLSADAAEDRKNSENLISIFCRRGYVTRGISVPDIS